MPKMLCKCGKILNYSNIPCEIEYLLISDSEYDKISSTKEEGTVNFEEIYNKMISMFVCPACGRLYIFWKGFNEEPIEYTPTN